MNPERRCIHRERPAELCYIQFEPESGGMVLNASEKGLAFHAVATVRHAGPFRLCISPNPTQRIELIAEIAWMDETKKFGGLRFTELSVDAGNQIRRWLAQTNGLATSDGKFAVPTCALREEADSCSHAQNGTADLLLPTPALHNVAPTRTDSTTPSGPRFGSIPAPALPRPFSEEKQIALFQPRLLRGLATGFLVLVFVLMPFLFLENFRGGIGNSLIRLGQKLKGNSGTPADTALSAPVQSSSPSAGGAPSVAAPVPETAATETSGPSDSRASTQATQGTVNSTDSHREERQFSRQHFADVSSRRHRSALARQLWSAVEAGDHSAEVALAQLYLTGDGVPRNCEQARVLLRAASKNGNREAMQQLRKLNRTCR
jgi:PilZ domain-containing protein